MSMLPRLKPENFYDLVVEVAIVRPGPIQGGMVHPYLQRRDNPELVEYPSPALKEVLKRTLGVPLFQEQAMQIAIVGAGFTDAEADQLRRAMATFRHTGQVVHFRQRFIAGMLHNDYPLEFAERCFDQIEGFGEYGFPESHAASFAILVYASAWIKCFHPDVFCAAILNSQPMGFYKPAQLVRDARDHGVEIRPADVNYSDWDCTLEPKCDGTHAVRLGLRLIQGTSEEQITGKLMKKRGGGYDDPHDLCRRSGMDLAMLERLAEGDAFGSMGLDRRAALWMVKGLRSVDEALLAATGADGDLFGAEARITLPPMSLPEQVAEDYTATGLSLKAHPLLFFRRALTERHVITATQHREKRRAGRQVQVAGLVLTRQRPGTANGVMFLTLEDETGPVNVIVWPALFEAQRHIAMGARFLLVRGKLQRAGDVIHVVAEELEDLSPHLAKLRDDDNAELRVRSRDFH
jgi:error-prone DNA polymerase